MTQFLLVQSGSKPSMASYSVTPTTDEDYLDTIARREFGVGDPIWTIRPRAGEMDDVITASQLALENGTTYEETSLGGLMASLVETCQGLALFMFSYPDDLPTAATIAMLHESVEAQLRDRTAMGEVYVRWRRS
jgi:hypothetical protein